MTTKLPTAVRERALQIAHHERATTSWPAPWVLPRAASPYGDHGLAPPGRSLHYAGAANFIAGRRLKNISKPG